MKDSVIFSHQDSKEGIFVEHYKSPIGDLCIGASNQGLRWIKVIQETKPIDRPNSITELAIAQLDAYFDRKLQTFDLPLDLSGNPEFTHKVWKQLQQIPFGQTKSYMELAKALGDVKSIRAVGTANGRNPIPIIIPCHRVIGSDGSLVGYALGLDIKKKLLVHENPKKYNFHQTTLFS